MDCDDFFGGQPWIESQPPVPDKPISLGDRNIKAIIRVGDMLQQLHSVDFVLVDFRPETFMQTDFGLCVRDLRDRISTAGQLGPPPDFLPAYAAPKIVNAKQKIRHRTDVFHLGMLFYYLASRKFPEGTTKEGLKDFGYRVARYRIYDPTFPLGFEHLWRKPPISSPRAIYIGGQFSILRRQGP